MFSIPFCKIQNIKLATTGPPSSLWWGSPAGSAWLRLGHSIIWGPEPNGTPPSEAALQGPRARPLRGAGPPGGSPAAAAASLVPGGRAEHRLPRSRAWCHLPSCSPHSFNHRRADRAQRHTQSQTHSQQSWRIPENKPTFFIKNIFNSSPEDILLLFLIEREREISTKEKTLIGCLPCTPYRG